MDHDLIISGGTVIDGTGADGFRADIAVDNGRITRIGDLGAAGAKERIDATDRLVTPGFVDLHTHLDAQIGWDPELRSSSWHGVTTTLIGNCGVTFAPVGEKNRRYLAELMEAVEDISADAIMDGLPWTWTSFGGYLDAIQTLRPALNVVGLAGHSAIRLEAMGDRSLDEGEQPDDRELRSITDMVRASIQEGAAGFSTSRLLAHRVPDGRCTPGTWADEREISAIQRAIVEAGGRGGLYQVVPDMQTRQAIDYAMLAYGAEVGCQVMYSGGVGGTGDGGVGNTAAFLDRNNQDGRRMTVICQTRPSGSLFGLARLYPFRTPAWKTLMSLPTLAERMEVLRDPARRETLVREAREAGFRIDPKALHPLGHDQRPDYDLDRKESRADCRGGRQRPRGCVC